MYVSSFSTYINAESSRRTQSTYPQKGKNSSDLFETKLLSKTVKNIDTSLNLPISYISNYKALSIQQKLQDNKQNEDKAEFVKMQTLNSAQNAYTNNSKIFSLLLQPKIALDQTPKIDKELSQELQYIKESSLRHVMVNTYVSNENYYKITA